MQKQQQQLLKLFQYYSSLGLSSSKDEELRSPMTPSCCSSWFPKLQAALVEQQRQLVGLKVLL
jgi:hypothetical protein